MKKYKHLLFDLDHTLWDFEKNSLDALHELFDEFGLNRFFIDFEEFAQIYHKINSKLWSYYGRGKISRLNVKYDRFTMSLEKGNCFDKDLAHNLADEYVKRSPCKTHLIEGSLELLQALLGSYRMHIITNGFNEVQYKKLFHSGLSPFFETVFTSEDAGFQKPDEGFFNFVFERNGIRPSNSLVIGDNLLTDIKGARDYGVDTVFYNPGWEKDYIGSTFVVSHLSEILFLL